MYKLLIPIILAALLPLSLASAQVFQFQNYTNKDRVNSLESFAGYVWASTTGGVVRIDPSTHAVTAFINSDGLGSIRINFAAYAGTDIAYFGSADGMLSRYDIENGEFSVTQLRSRDGNAISLNDADTSGNFLWIASGVGLIKYDRVRNGGEVKETYRTLGSFQTESAVNKVVVFDGKIVAGTGEGIAFADLGNEFLLDPQEWENIVLGSEGNSDIAVTAMGIQGQTLYIGTNQGLYSWDGVGDLTVVGVVGNGYVHDLKIGPSGQLYAVMPGTHSRDLVNILSGESLVTGLSDAVQNSLVTAAYSNGWFVGSSSQGIYESATSGAAERIVVAGPSSNNLVGGGYSGDSLFVVARDNEMSIFYNGTWSRRFISNFEKLGAIVDRSGGVWICTFGDGAYHILADGSSQRFAGDNSPLIGIAQSPIFSVVNSVYEDVDGRIWFSLFQTEPLRPMVVFSPVDSQWSYFGEDDGLIEGDNQVIAGGVGNAAIGVNDQGIAFLRYGVDPFNHSDDEIGYFSRSRRLPSAIVSALAYDRDNVLWVGTIQGLTYFDHEIGFFFPAELPAGVGSNITAIEADTRNNLWVGTTEGLAYLPGGTGESVAFTTANSELVSDEIEALVYDADRRQLLAFTRGGLSVIDYDPSGQDGSDAIYAYPNPFVIGSSSDNLLQFRIEQRGEVRIFTIAADLVRTTTVNDGWDGKNSSGDFVASGVYIWEVKAEDGSYYNGKVLVVRR